MFEFLVMILWHLVGLRILRMRYSLVGGILWYRVCARTLCTKVAAKSYKPTGVPTNAGDYTTV